MGVKEVPATTIFDCDRCGNEETVPMNEGPVGRPPNWMHVNLAREKVNVTNGGDRIKFLLCPKCADEIEPLIIKAMKVDPA